MKDGLQMNGTANYLTATSFPMANA